MRLAARGGLAIVAAAQAEIGLWALTAPHSFFTTFPGLGHHWVAPLGAYNEHLVRDYAAAELGFAVLLASAVVWFERRLVLVSGAVFLVATVPHFVYHLTTTDHLSATDNTASLAAFLLELIVVVSAMVAVTRARAAPRPVEALGAEVGTR
jgi:hypothetical protein